MGKHTPGPWYQSSTGNHQGLVVAETNGENIAAVYDKANAALIAAAPEMLEALRKLKDSTSADAYIPDWQTLVRGISDAAITKAEGR